MMIFIIFLIIIDSLSADRMLRYAVELWSLTNSSQFELMVHPILEAMEYELKYWNFNKHLQNNFGNNSTCFKDIAQIIESSRMNTLGGLKWIDSSAKIPAGLMGGAMSWNGNAAECLNNYWVRKDNSMLRTIVPKYCTSRIGIPPEPRILAIKFGYCLPENCKSKQIVDLIHSLLKGTFPNATTATSCQVKNDPSSFDSWFIIAVIFCIIFIILIFSATFWDILIYIKWKQLTQNSAESYQRNVRPNDSNELCHSNEDISDSRSLLSRELFCNPLPQYRKQYIESHGKSRNLLVFSILENTKRLFSGKVVSKFSESSPTSLDCLHGIRSITMMWIVLGHVVIMSLLYSNNPLFYLKEQSQKWTFQVLVGATVSVDTFFFMSGLLTTFLCLPELEKCNNLRQKGKFWLIFVLRRIFRLTPLLLCVTILYTGIYPYVSAGQIKSFVTEMDMQACRDHWWISYLNNFFYVDDMCMAWTWYLANELQFSLVLAPIFLSLAAWKSSFGILFITALISSSIVSSAYFTLKYDLKPAMLAAVNPEFPKFYFRPYNRWGTYAIGLLTGWFLLKRISILKNNHPTKNIYLPIIGLSLSGAIMLVVVYGLYGIVSEAIPPPSVETSAAYNSLIRPSWAIALSIVVILCASGFADPVNDFLAANIFIPIGRLTYAIYLVHPIVIAYILESSQQAPLLDDVFVAVYFIASFILSAMIAYLLSMAVEFPLTSLSNLRLKGKI